MVFNTISKVDKLFRKNIAHNIMLLEINTNTIE